MQKGPQETIKLPPGAQIFLAHLAFFLMRDHCAGAEASLEAEINVVSKDQPPSNSSGPSNNNKTGKDPINGKIGTPLTTHPRHVAMPTGGSGNKQPFAGSP